MPDYTLNIKIDDRGLETIYAASQRVTIVKSVPGGGATVAWVNFAPMQNNTITWRETYSVYASAAQIQNNAKIDVISTRVASPGNVYTFRRGAFDDGRLDGLSLTEYGVDNEDVHAQTAGLQMVTSGLYQGAIVNGEASASPLNAIALPYNESAVFTPVQKIQVFTSHHEDNGLVISRVSSKALTVDLTTVPAQTIHYNHLANEFAPGNL